MAEPTLDWTSDAGAKAAQRLRDDQIVWIATVRPDGQPHAVPVWFLWDGERATVFSKPDQKVRNLGQNPRATMHFNSTADGGDVVILEGQAELPDESAAQVLSSAYLEKYGEGIKFLGMTPETMTAEFHRVIRFRPAKVLGW